MKRILFIFLILFPLLSFSQLSVKSVSTSHGRIGFYQFTPPGYKPDSSYEYPLIIFMHGVGERGNGTSELSLVLNASLPKIIAKGASMTFSIQGKKHAFLVLMPQMSREYINWQNFYVEEMIRYAKGNLKIDSNRIFLTGWSLGGGGAWKFPTASLDSANLIAGIVPVAPAPNYSNVCNISKGRVAVWAHHALDDSSIPLRYTKDAITGINACNPEIEARMTYYGKGKHTLVSIIAYDTLNTYEYPNMFQWMAGISRKNRKASNLYPVANAGRDTTTFFPTLTAILDGSLSYDPNDVIVGYLWRKISGPSSPNLHIARKDFPKTVVSGLEPGKYVFRLTVMDAFGFTRADDVNIEVAQPANEDDAAPYVSAGKDRITRDQDIVLKGAARNFSGQTVDCSWRQISGPSQAYIHADGVINRISGLKRVGTYSFELKGSDPKHPSVTTSDTVVVVKKPKIPVFIIYAIRGVPPSSGLWKPSIFPLIYAILAIGYVLLEIYLRRNNMSIQKNSGFNTSFQEGSKIYINFLKSRSLGAIN